MTGSDAVIVIRDAINASDNPIETALNPGVVRVDER